MVNGQLPNPKGGHVKRLFVFCTGDFLQHKRHPTQQAPKREEVGTPALPQRSLRGFQLCVPSPSACAMPSGSLLSSEAVLPSPELTSALAGVKPAVMPPLMCEMPCKRQGKQQEAHPQSLRRARNTQAGELRRHRAPADYELQGLQGTVPLLPSPLGVWSLSSEDPKGLNGFTLLNRRSLSLLA